MATKYMAQVLCNDYAGSLRAGWRPAVDGTLNQTGESADNASTVDTYEKAEWIVGYVLQETDIDEDCVRIIEV